jgi:hypothetical protein
LAGRLLSLLATLGTGFMLSRWLRDLGADTLTRLAAAAAFMGSAMLFIWLVLCRADALSTLLGGGTLLAAYAAGRGRPSLVWVAAALGVAACFTRQSNALLVVAGFAGSWPSLRRKALLGLLVAGASSLALLLALNLWTDGAFWHSVSVVVSWTKRAPFKVSHLWRYLASQLGLVLLALAGLGVARLRRAVPLGAWLGLLAGAYLAAETTRVGAGTNHLLPFHLLLVLVAAQAAAGLRALGGLPATLATLVLVAQLGADAADLARTAAAIPDGALANTTRVEQYLRSLQGPLLLDRQVVLWLYTGRRDHFVEVAGLGLDDHHGQAQLEPLLDFVRHRGFAAILLRANTLMPPRVTAEIGRAYAEQARVSLWDGQYLLLTPQSPSP